MAAQRSRGADRDGRTEDPVHCLLLPPASKASAAPAHCTLTWRGGAAASLVSASSRMSSWTREAVWMISMAVAKTKTLL